MAKSKQGKSLPNLYRKRRELLKKLHSIGPPVRGSIYQYSRFCGKKSCRRCQRGEGHSGLFLSVSIERKTHMVSLSTSSKEERAKEWSSNYKELQKIVEKITRINLELLSGK